MDDAIWSQYDSIQILALDLARQLPTPRVKSKRKALRPTLDKANQAIEDYASFMQRVIESDRFESNRKRILDDAGFTLSPPRVHPGPMRSYNKPDFDYSELEDDL